MVIGLILICITLVAANWGLVRCLKASEARWLGLANAHTTLQDKYLVLLDEAKKMANIISPRNTPIQ